ncbi:MAG: hypothetical protein K9K88_00855 [Desulfobacterales bacterium]|nr:hypothetical protein [Desulfobacterales bacterium]
MIFILKTFLICTIYTLASFGAGLLFYKNFLLYKTREYGKFSVPLIASIFLFGSGIMANIWLLILSFSFFYRWVITIIVCLSSIYAIHLIWAQFAVLKSWTMRSIGFALPESIIWKTIVLFTMAITVQAGIVCFAPLEPNGDAAAFYMVLPKLFTETKKIALLGGYESFMTIGLHGELHFAALMMLGAASGAKFITWPIAISCGIILAAIAHQNGMQRYGKTLVIIFLFTSTAFILLIGDGKTDLFGAAMACAALYWVFEKKFVNRNVQYFIVGIFSGFSVVAKISYLPLVLPCITILIFWDHFAETSKDRLLLPSRLSSLALKLTWMVVGVLLPFMLHFLKNWVLFSEPFAPFLYFGQDPFGGNWANQSWFPPETICKIIITYPLALIYGKYPMQYGNLSVLLLAFFPLLFLIPRQGQLLKSKMFQISVIAMAGVVAWVVLRPGVFAPRYILYTLLLLILPVAAATEHVLKNERQKRIISAAVTGVCLFYLIGFNGILMIKNSERFKENPGRTALQNASELLNQEAEADERVISLNYFTYWLRPDLLETLSKDTENNAFRKIKTGKQAWKYLHHKGFRYVLIDRTTHGKAAEILDPDQAPEGITAEEVFNELNYSVFRLTSAKLKS